MDSPQVLLEHEAALKLLNRKDLLEPPAGVEPATC
jgi:hypothetical protein